MEISSYSLLKNNNEKPTKLYNPQNSVYERDNRITMPRVCPAYYSPSFTAMKKKEFDGTDRLVVEKFKAPIQTFKTKDDFNDWANKRTEEIFEKDYTGRTTESTIQRKAMLGEWRKYIFEENKEYTPAQRLLIADGITKELSDKNDSIPPTLNKGVLAGTICNLKETLKNEPDKKDFNFNKTYQNNLRLFYTKDIEGSTGTNQTGWVTIPSKENDPEHFEENVEKLKAFSHPSWCTKSNNAEPYLSQGDFHIYLENGKPKLGIRFIGDVIEEIQGPKNNGKIPFEYYDTCRTYIEENEYELSNKVNKEIKHAEILKEKYVPFVESMKNASSEEIFKKLNIEAEKDKNGLYTISHFEPTDEMKKDDVFFGDLKIDYDKLLEKVKEVKGNFDIRNTDIKKLPNLTKIGGTAYFNRIKIEDMSGLETIGGNASFWNAEIGDMSGLETVGGNADFSGAKIGDMSGLTEIGGDASFWNAEIGDMSGLGTIGRNADFENAKIGNMSGLTTIGGTAYFNRIKIEDMSGLETIGGDAIFWDAEIGDMSGLETIGGDADFRGAKIGDMSGLEAIGGDADFRGAKIKSNLNIKEVGAEVIYIKDAEIPNLDELYELLEEFIFN